MARLEDLVVNLRGDVSNLKSALNQAQRDINNLAKTVNNDLDRVQKKTKSLGSSFGDLGDMIKTYIGLQTARSIGQTALQMDALDSKMSAAVGSGENAASAMAFIRAEAERLGLVFIDSANAFAGFAASATRSGLTLDQTKIVFRGVAEAAAAMQLSMADQSLVFKAVEQMAAKGVVSMEELRGQLGERLPGAIQIFAQAMGVGNDKFMEMIENGEVGTTDLIKMGEALSVQFGDAAQQAAQKAQASINRFINTINDLKITLANSGAMDVFIMSLKGMQAALVMAESQIEILFTRASNNLARFKNSFIDLYNDYVDIKKKFGMEGDYKANLPALTYEGQIKKEENILAMSAERLAKIYEGAQEKMTLDPTGTGVGASSQTKAQKEALKEMQKEAEKVRKDTLTYQEQYKEEMEELDKLLKNGMISNETYARAAKKAQDELKDSMLDSLNVNLDHIRSFKDLKNVAIDALMSIAKSGLKGFASNLFGDGGSLSGAFGGLFDGFKSGFGTLLGGLFGRATGGPVSPNVPYVVGERGPELFVPSVGGQVMNKNQVSGMSKSQPVTVVQNISIGTSVGPAVRAEVMRMMPELRQMSISAVEDARYRGATI